MLKFKFLLFFIVSFSSILLANNSLLQKKITLSSEPKTVIEVLHEIEKETGITFSFKSNIFDKNRNVSIEEKELSISEILDILFANKNIQYKEFGDQILLFVDKNEENIKTNPPDEDDVMVKVVNDTVFRYINTTKVKVYDTVRYVFYDTIRSKIEKPGPNISFELGVSPFYDFSTITPNSDDYTYFSDIINTAGNPLLSCQVYAKVNKSVNRMKLSTGIIYSNEREDVNYKTNEVYSRTVTGTLQNWISQLDTSFREVYNSGMGGKPDSVVWTYIYTKNPVDTLVTYIKTDSIQLNYNGKNNYQYLQFPLTIGWQKQFSEKIDFSVSTGPSINLLISKKGKILNPSSSIQLVDYKEVPFIKLNTSWLVNASLYYKFKPNLAGNIQVSYNQSLQSSFSSNFPFKKYSRALIFSFGIAYYL